MMPLANLALAAMAGEEAAQVALEKITAGTAGQNELNRAYEGIVSLETIGDPCVMEAAVTGFHRALQKRLEAI